MGWLPEFILCRVGSYDPLSIWDIGGSHDDDVDDETCRVPWMMHGSMSGGGNGCSHG